MGFLGSEEFIRLQFEEYLLALLASTKYHDYLQQPDHKPLPNIEGDPTSDFGTEWLQAWQQTSSFTLFNRVTDSHLFDIVEPRHPTAGNLTIEDVQRRLNQQFQTLHLDERFATSKEALNKHFATGQKKVSETLSGLWAELEARREAQRRRHSEQQTGTSTPTPTEGGENGSPAPSSSSVPVTHTTSLVARGPDLTAAQASVQAAGQKAGAYFQSWGSWAAERKKDWAAGRKGCDTSTVADENATPNLTPVSTNPKAKEEPSPGKLSRWSSIGSAVSLGRGGGGAVEEEKGADGIGRLNA